VVVYQAAVLRAQEAYDAAVAAAIAEAEAAAKAEAEKAKKGCDWNPFGGNSCLAAAVDVVTHIDPATIAHAVLGVVAMVPITPINSIAAVVDAGLYVAEGDYAAAAMSMLGVIPGGAILAKVGTAAVAVKGASTVIRGASNIVKTGASAARTAASATATAAKVKLLNTMGRGMEKLESAVPGLQKLTNKVDDVSKVGAKRGPKPAGEGPHNMTRDRRIAELKDQGYSHQAGGSLREEVIYTPNGLKSARRPDITMIAPDGSVYYEQIGKANRFGLPIKREQDAINDIFGETGVLPVFTPYNR
jgi:hypothetical protein